MGCIFALAKNGITVLGVVHKNVSIEKVKREF